MYGIEASIDEIEVRCAAEAACDVRRAALPVPASPGAALTRLRPRRAQHHGSTDLLVTLAVMQHKGAFFRAWPSVSRLLT